MHERQPQPVETRSFDQIREENLRKNGLMPKPHPLAGRENRFPEQFGKGAPPRVVFEQ